MRLSMLICSKKNVLLSVLILGVMFTIGITTADAEDNVMKKIAANTYVGVSAGPNFSNYPDTNDDGSVSDVSTDESDMSYKVRAGYEINDNVAVEASYHDLGESNFKATSSGGPSWEAGSVSAKQEADGYGLSVVGRYPVNDRFALLGSLGIFWWKSTETWVEPSATTVQEESGSSMTYGGGVEYDVGVKDNYVFRAEVEHHEIDSSDDDVNTLSVGAVYKFE